MSCLNLAPVPQIYSAPLTVHAGPWATSKLTANLGAILLREGLGYQVTFSNTTRSIGDLMAAGEADLDFEILSLQASPKRYRNPALNTPETKGLKLNARNEMFERKRSKPIAWGRG